MIDRLIQKRCLVCGTGIYTEYTWAVLAMKANRRRICAGCETKLVPLKDPRCRICSRPLSDLPADYRKDGICGDCLQWEQAAEWQGVLTGNRSLYAYDDYLKELMALFKYRGDYAIADVFGPMLKQASAAVDFDYAVPVPLSEERLQERGFNQSEALIIAAGLEPVRMTQRMNTEKQSKKSRTERLQLTDVFRTIDDLSIRHKSILVVDDIYTTGSTLRHIAKVLKQAGAEKVCSLTVAR
ncbi:MAG: ComF family protein [Bacillus sp. (in: firmicutes)]